MPSQTLYLVRHGESTANHAVKNGVSSAYLLTDAALTESGENQARAISTAVALEGQPRPELLLVSPLRRTMQTAVLGFGEAVPHLLRPDIQETGNTPADRGDPKLGAALVREHGWASYAESYAALPAEWAVKGAGWKASARRRFQALLEFVAGRLYTGPMFIKYNAVLRGHGNGAAPPFLRQQFELVCRGNIYGTTLHVIDAAISKLAKIMRAETVYRAPGGLLPREFWVEDDASGTIGGVEFAFMSATTERAVALDYARRGKAGVLLEIRQGLTARGASLQWLSQYPFETETCFPPLCGLTVDGKRVEGSLLIVELSASTRTATKYGNS
mmetsp:Transcript_40793/g.119043  ORF Transcript_40793/g.119043 Transcript_40793/m.119043 type:complete len:330 (-) Transcript_40793:173-1162(-)